MSISTSSSTPSRKEIIVLGAGVIGLTTALRLQELGSNHVTVIADILPSDPKSIRYTSRWAGAHHVFNPMNSDTKLHQLEKETFQILWALSAPGSETEECFLRIPQTEYFFGDRPNATVEGKTGGIEPLEAMPEFRHLKPEELIPGATAGCTFHTVTIDVPIYLNYLLTRLIAAGGRVLRGNVQHIQNLIEGGTSLFSGGSIHDPLPDAIVIACGMGARFLGGVEDKAMYPVRGQTVIVRAPWVRFGRTSSYPNDDGPISYIIPRRSSDVIVGGIRVENDWFPRPRPETTDDILRRGFKLCPELAPPDIRAVREPTLEDIKAHVVGVGCGLRPARKGGVRLETEWAEAPHGKVLLVYNYGHAGYGYQSSWGCADKVVELIAEAKL